MTDLAMSLYEFEGTEQPQETFTITDEAQLVWAFRKLRKIRMAANEVKETAAAEMERVTRWQETRLESLEREDGYFSNLIETYYREQLARDPKAKCSTPYGKATKRTTAVWDYGNEEALTKALMGAAPECVKTEYKLNKAELKKAAAVLEDGRVALDGEILDGVTVEKELRITVTTEG